MTSKTHLFFIFFLFAVPLIFSSRVDAQCTYRIRLKTGTRSSSGTDARVSLTLFDRNQNRVHISNLQSWGAMGAGHDYFENGNLDRFEGSANCLPSKVCMINLVQDGSGKKPGWFVENVVVTSPASTQEQVFNINRWLAVDEPPHQLNAVVNNCFSRASADGGTNQVEN